MDQKTLQNIKNRYEIVGNCEALNHAIDIALQVAKTDLSVLILGESGVGKDVIPRLMHDNSLRSGRPYFPINCGSIPEGTIDSELFGHEKGSFTGAIGEHKGYFGMADGGTLFLDEVGELPMSTQARLLRVLESGEYIRVGGNQVMKTNVRVIAATNVNIQKAISEGKFREDLYYRLCGTSIKMPPLRERGDDIVKLFKKFAIEIADKYSMPQYLTLTFEAEEVLKRYKWPGNIRQLKNVTEEMSILLRDTRSVTPEILAEYGVWPTVEENGGLVRVGHSDSNHSYQVEREMLFQMLNALHQEIQTLHQEIDQLKGTAHHTHDNIQNVGLMPSASLKADEAETLYAEEYIENPSRAEAEKQQILKALERHAGNRGKAAQDLNISERTLYRKIKKHGLED